MSTGSRRSIADTIYMLLGVIYVIRREFLLTQFRDHLLVHAVCGAQNKFLVA
jgi:hypothetical protein